MTEPFLNLLEGKALLEQERRDRMPQIVKPDARQTGAAADAPELAGNIVRAERRAVLTDADIIALVVGFAVFPAVFLLAAAKIGQIPPQRVRQRQRAVARAGLDVIDIENPRKSIALHRSPAHSLRRRP